MDTITSHFNAFAAIFAVLLVNVELGAIAVGTLSAIVITQVVKMCVIQSNLPNGPWRVWYLTTVTIGTVITWLNWQTKLGFSWGIIAGGIFAPLIYWAGTRGVLYKLWPDLQYKISATPKDD